MKWSWRPGGRPSRAVLDRLDTTARSPVQWDVGTGAAILEADDRAPQEYGDSNTRSERIVDVLPDGSRPLADCVPPSIPGDAAIPFHGGICSRSESRPPRGLPPRLWRGLDVRAGRLERDAPAPELAGRAFRSGVDDGRLRRKTVLYTPPPAGRSSLVVHREQGFHHALRVAARRLPDVRGDHLPRHPEAVVRPAATTVPSPSRQRVPVRVEFLLRLATQHEGDRGVHFNIGPPSMPGA